MFTQTLHENGVLELVVDRPPVNAFSIGLLKDLAACVNGVSARPEVKVVILRSAGRGFCGGGDVKEVEALSGFQGILGQCSGSLALSLAVLQCAVPVICAIHAYCVGVGMLVVGSADILIASRDTRFVMAEIDNGATAGGVQALKLMPEKRVRAAMLTAEPVFAPELHALGSVYRLVETHAQVPEEAMRVAAVIAAKSPDAVRRMKASLNNTTRAHDLVSVYRAEMSYTYELNIMGVASEGRSAFIAGDREGYAG